MNKLTHKAAALAKEHQAINDRKQDGYWASPGDFQRVIEIENTMLALGFVYDRKGQWLTEEEINERHGNQDNR